MSKQEIDDYLAGVEESKRTALQQLRTWIVEIIPDAEQCMSYSMPGFRLEGKMIAGFAAYKKHLSYFPHSGSVIPELGDEVAPYATSTGTLQFTVETPLTRRLVEKLIAVRLRQARGR